MDSSLHVLQHLAEPCPLLVKRDGTIISGHQRWQAAKQLGSEALPCEYVSFTNELEEQESIIHSNRYRRKTLSQMMREAEHLEEIETEKARRRQATSTGGSHPQLVENFPQAETGKTRDKVAGAIGIGSGKQYEKAKTVWEAAKGGNEMHKRLSKPSTKAPEPSMQLTET